MPKFVSAVAVTIGGGIAVYHYGGLELAAIAIIIFAISLYFIDKSLLPAETTSHDRPLSLRNLGVNCYLNSALQGVSSCVKFTEDLDELSNRLATPKLEILNHLIGQLNGRSAKEGSYEISHNPIFREWNKPGQQDSFELLSYMIDQVYQEIRNKLSEKDNYRSDQWFKETLPMRIILKYYIKCKCGPIETPFQVDLAFHVPLCGKLNLDDLIKNFFNENDVEGFNCDNCAGSQVTRQIKLIEPLPNTLCVHLQQSRWNGRYMEKIDSKITFTETLHIKRSYLLVQTEQKEDGNETDVKEKIDLSISSEQTVVYFQSINLKSNKYNHDNEKKDSNNVGNQNVDEEKTTHLDFVQQKAEGGRNEANFKETEIENFDKITDLVLSEPEVDKENKKTNVGETGSRNIDQLSSDLMADSCKRDANVEDKENKDNRKMHSNNHNDRVIDEHKDDDIIQTYSLSSVIVHYGGVYGGHYVCYKKCGGDWYLTNDSCIKITTWKEVEYCNPYILFYEKP